MVLRSNTTRRPRRDRCADRRGRRVRRELYFRDPGRGGVAAATCCSSTGRPGVSGTGTSSGIALARRRESGLPTPRTALVAIAGPVRVAATGGCCVDGACANLVVRATGGRPD